MPRDEVAEHNRKMWDRLAAAGIPYTRPVGRPPRDRAGMRRFVDPRRRLAGVRLGSGTRVLCLAGGGGWDPVVFARLGCQSTVFDISQRQLRTVRDLARRQRVAVRALRGDMRDLSRFADRSFDIVWHCHSLVFVPDVAPVFREVARILAPGGVYVTGTMHPTTLRLYRTWRGGGYLPRITYFDDGPVPYTSDEDATWEFGKVRVVAPTLEYGHRFETLVNGLVATGFAIEGLWEHNPVRPRKTAEPGSDEHLECHFPAFVEVRARKGGT